MRRHWLIAIIICLPLWATAADTWAPDYRGLGDTWGNTHRDAQERLERRDQELRQQEIQHRLDDLDRQQRERDERDRQRREYPDP